jgi:hypothetical protein
MFLKQVFLKDISNIFLIKYLGFRNNWTVFYFCNLIPNYIINYSKYHYFIGGYMQHRIIKPSRLLDRNGELIQKGYALSPLLTYCRKDVARKLHLKEWDYYLIYNQYYAVALTVGQSVNFVLFSASFIDFSKTTERTKSLLRIVSRKKLRMPESSVEGDIVYQSSDVHVSFKLEAMSRQIDFTINDFANGTEFEASFELRIRW